MKIYTIFLIEFKLSVMFDLFVNNQKRISGVIMVTLILILIENFRNPFFDEIVKQIEF